MRCGECPRIRGYPGRRRDTGEDGTVSEVPEASLRAESLVLTARTTFLIEATTTMVQKARAGVPPPPFTEDEELFEQLLDYLTEQSESLSLLCQNGLYRPAYAVLRSILETIAKLVWVTLEPRYKERFLEGSDPGTKNVLEVIGWLDEHERTFRPLSAFVHTDSKVSVSDFYHYYELEEGGLFPEVRADAEYYVIEEPTGSRVVSLRTMTHSEARSLHEPYLAAKAFDLVSAGLYRLYGDRSEQEDWWSRSAFRVFVKLCLYSGDFAYLMRWSPRHYWNLS